MIKTSRLTTWYAALVLPVTFIPGIVYADTYTVTTLQDSGAGSLRQAIIDANATLGVADTIEFQAGLTGTITLNSQIDITDKLTINGPGAAVLAISGGQTTRLFAVNAMKTTIAGLTLKEGKSNKGGGAILNQGTLTLSQLVLTNNNASDSYSGNGGAIYNEGVLTMTEVTVANSTTTKKDGGGLFNKGTATVNSSTFSGNTAANNGGAIANKSGAQLTITHTVLNGNRSSDSYGEGGAIYNEGTLSLQGSTLSANQSANDGSGIYNEGTLTIANSTFIQNHANGSGGAIGSGYSSGVVTIQNSTFSENYAGEYGGALYVYKGTFTLLNNTFTENYAAGYGGSVYQDSGTVKMGNTISIGNFSPKGPEIYKYSGAEFMSQGNNLFGSNGNSGIVASYGTVTLSPTDLILAGGPETVLAELADNGGPTQTHALINGSPAINAGNNTLLPTDLITDQRGEGFARIVGDAADIGAFEYGSGGAVKNQLNVSIEPANAGAVTSDVTGIDCGGDCAEKYDASQSIQLTAKPAAGYVFSKWTGGCSGTTATCTVKMDQPRSVTATFIAATTPTYSLSVSVVGTGTITSADKQINCGNSNNACTANYSGDAQVTLTANGALKTWGGDCAGNAKTCTVSMNALRNVTATFNSTTPVGDLAITKMVITPITPAATARFEIAITVKNSAPTAIDAGYLTVWKNQTTSAVCGASGDARTKVGSLSSGASRTLKVRLRAGAAGNATARAFIDSACATTEPNEKDNQMTKSYSVK